MTFDLAGSAVPLEQQYDVCVAGAGAAGITLALLLLRAGRTVLLLESGGRGFEEDTQDLYRSMVAGQRHTGIHEGRFRTWGGTTTRWGGQILELEDIDFERREWVARSGWPIGKHELESAYQMALEVEGLTGALLNDDAVWGAVGEAAPDLGTGLKPYFTRWCPQPDFGKLHGPELVASAKLTVLLHANVVDFKLDGSRVRSVVCRSLNGHEATVHANEFVLAIGAIETSRLLLNMERQHGAMWNPNGLAGCGFQDHVDCEVARITPLDRARFKQAFTNVLLRGYKYHPKFRLSEDEQRRLRVLNVAATVTFQDDSEEIAGAVKATGRKLLRRAWGEVDGKQVVHLVTHLPLLLRQVWSYAVRHRVYNSPAARLSLRVHCEQQPDTRSRVTLAEERDALGLLRARLDWTISPLELKTIRGMYETVRQTFREQGYGEVSQTFDLDDDAALRERCDDGLHHIGGTVMSSDSADGVVDPDLRLHGMGNLSICSASVFPTGGYSNPTHTVLALAVRLAERLSRAGARENVTCR